MENKRRESALKKLRALAKGSVDAPVSDGKYKFHYFFHLKNYLLGPRQRISRIL